MTSLLMAQTTEPALGVSDLVKAREVVPFQAAAILLLLMALIYLFRLRETERREHVEHLKQLVKDFSADNKGDSRA